MDFLRAAEALLRSPHPLLPFLAPSAARSTVPRRIATFPRECLRQQQTARPLTTSAVQRADGASSEPKDDIGGALNDLLDGALDQNKRSLSAPVSRTSRYASTRAQQTTPSSRIAEQRARGQSSLQEILDGMTPRSGNRDGLSSDKMDISAMLDPNRANPAIPQEPPKPPMKLNSSVGRTIQVQNNRGMDVGRAFRTLDARCAQNSVRKDMMRQRFHERPGLKRKRLNSERWRKRFKESFRATIKLVQGLKKQGW